MAGDDIWIKPGLHVLQIYAERSHIIEKGYMKRSSAYFWSQKQRSMLLKHKPSFEDAIYAWDEERHGCENDIDDEMKKELGYYDELEGYTCTLLYKPRIIISPEALTYDSRNKTDIPLIPIIQNLNTYDSKSHFDMFEDIYSPLDDCQWCHCRDYHGSYCHHPIQVYETTNITNILNTERFHAFTETNGNFIFSLTSKGCSFEWTNCSQLYILFSIRKPNYLRLFKIVVIMITRILSKYKEAVERLYAPGSTGFLQCQQHFYTCMES